MTTEGCVKRFRAAQDSRNLLSESHCRTCPEGAARAGTQPVGEAAFYRPTGRIEGEGDAARAEYRCGCGELSWAKASHVRRKGTQMCRACSRRIPGREIVIPANESRVGTLDVKCMDVYYDG
jgi:hypothetical protein